jgi:hypothetical protein
MLCFVLVILIYYAIISNRNIRNANNNIIQFLYGEDGMDPVCIEKQSLSIVDMSYIELENKPNKL